MAIVDSANSKALKGSSPHHHPLKDVLGAYSKLTPRLLATTASCSNYLRNQIRYGERSIGTSTSTFSRTVAVHVLYFTFGFCISEFAGPKPFSCLFGGRTQNSNDGHRFVVCVSNKSGRGWYQ